MNGFVRLMVTALLPVSAWSAVAQAPSHAPFLNIVDFGARTDGSADAAGTFHAAIAARFLPRFTWKGMTIGIR